MNDLAAFQEKDSKLTTLVNAFEADLHAAGFTVEEASKLLSPRKKPGRKPGTKVTKKAAAKGKPDSIDSTGAMPMVGKTYVLPTGATWAKKQGGRPNVAFVAAVQAGKTWAELLKRGSAVKTPAKKAAAKKAPKKKSK